MGDVQHRTVLNVGARTDANNLYVTAHCGVGPYADVITEAHIPHDDRRGSIITARPEWGDAKTFANIGLTPEVDMTHSSSPDRISGGVLIPGAVLTLPARDLATLSARNTREASMSDSSPEPNQRPRFVAGAVCPSCRAEDRMVIDAGADERRCVACGFVEARPTPASACRQPASPERRHGASRPKQRRSACWRTRGRPALHNLKLCGELIKSIGIHNPVHRPYGSLTGRDLLPMLFSANSL